MNVPIDLELEELVRFKVETGSYASASAVIGEALRLLDERDRFYLLHSGDIRDQIAAGMKSLQSGKGSDGELVFARIGSELDATDRRDRM